MLRIYGYDDRQAMMIQEVTYRCARGGAYGRTTAMVPTMCRLRYVILLLS